MDKRYNLNDLNASQLDFFQEIENIGASHAATALSTLLNQPITLRVPNVEFCEFDHIADILDGPETLVVSLLVEMSGDLTGFILLVQKAEDARELSVSVVETMGMEVEESEALLTELQESALKEVANILSGAYLTALSQLTGLTIDSSVPKMVIDMAGAVMNLPAATYGEYGDIVLFMETEFQNRDEVLSGHFFLIPDIESFYVLMKTMGME